MRCWGHSWGSIWLTASLEGGENVFPTGALVLLTGASRVFTWPLFAGVSSGDPPYVLSLQQEKLVISRVGFQESQAEPSRPLKAQAWKWRRVTQRLLLVRSVTGPSRFRWLLRTGAVGSDGSGRDCWQAASSETGTHAIRVPMA